MKKLLLLLFICSITTGAFAQVSSKTLAGMHDAINNAMDDEDYKLALQKCDAVLKLKPKDSIALQRKVGAYFGLHRIDDCIKQARVAFPVKDTCAEILAGLSLNDDDRDDSALVWNDRNKLVSEALRLNKNSATANMSKAVLLGDKRNFDSALYYINYAVNVAKGDDKDHCRLVKAALYYDFDKTSESISQIKQVISDDPDFEPAHNFLVKLYRSEQMYPEAFDALQAHSKQFSSEADDVPVKFYILRDWGKKDEACALIKESNIDNQYVLDRAAEIGCDCVFANLKNNDNAEYSYLVDYDGSTYDFNIKKNKGNYANGDIDFNWEMTNNDEASGNIILTKAALDTARSEMNAFGTDMKSMTLTDKTTVWVSRAVFDDLTSKGEALIDADGTLRTFKVVEETQDDNDYGNVWYGDITYNDQERKRLHMLHLRSDDDDEYEIWINNDRNNPQIIKMKLSWTIELQTVKE